MWSDAKKTMPKGPVVYDDDILADIDAAVAGAPTASNAASKSPASTAAPAASQAGSPANSPANSPGQNWAKPPVARMTEDLWPEEVPKTTGKKIVVEESEGEVAVTKDKRRARRLHFESLGDVEVRRPDVKSWRTTEDE